MEASDIPLLCAYWLNNTPQHLRSMGVDLQKLPSDTQLTSALQQQLQSPVEERNSFCMIWEIDGNPVGHCNTNPTQYGKQAFMHIHLWQETARRKGAGSQLLQMTLPVFFDKLQLQKLFCQPYALNKAPNETLRRAGFDLIREYTTTPGSLNFEQPVKLWQMTRKKWLQLSEKQKL